MARGLKPLKLSPADFQDLVLFWLMENMDAKEIADLERRLTLPPPNTVIKKNDPVWSRDAEMAMFKSAMKPKKSS